MKTTITTKGFKTNGTIEKAVEEELERVVKMLPENVAFDIVLKKKRENECKCDISVRNAGAFIRGEAVVIGNNEEDYTDIATSSIDKAVDDLKRKIRKLKTSLIDRKRKSDRSKKESTEASYEAAEIEILDDADFASLLENEQVSSTAIEHERKIDQVIMNADEAIARMENLGQDFYAFKDYKNNVNVVYKREHGYGMLKCS